MIIYAYDTLTYRKNGWLKIGETTRDEYTRVAEQITASNPETLIIRNTWEIPDCFHDRDIHNILENRLGKKRIYIHDGRVVKEKEENGKIQFSQFPQGTEWFECSTEDVSTSINILLYDVARPHNWGMREEQKEAVDKTYNFYSQYREKSFVEFLWNCKCRFGKTFAAYNLMKRLGSEITVILTYKPAVGGEWETNLNEHTLFEDYKFFHALDFDRDNPITFGRERGKIVFFASFQDILGKDEGGSIKKKWKYILNYFKKVGIDLLIIDEEHFGSNTDNAKKIIKELNYHYRLNLSGTPLESLMSGNYTDENTYTWTYVNEQKKRREEEKNGYKTEIYRWLPSLNFYTYQPHPDVIKDAEQYYNSEEGLRLNKFFASDDGESFLYSASVCRWLDLLAAQDGRIWNSPFNNHDLANKLNHTFWMLPSVNSVKATRRLMESHPFFKQYRIITASDDNDGEGRDTVKLVRTAIKDNVKTITLSCGKLNTGVTIEEWTGVFWLTDTESPESYWQTNFRPQSSCKRIGKTDCYVFDFNPNRTLKLIYEYCEKIAKKKQRTTDCIREFLDVVKVFSYEQNKLIQMTNDNLEKIIESVIDSAKNCRGFESVHMVNVNNVNDRVKEILALVEQASGIKIPLEISKSDLNQGKTFKKNENGKKRSKTDPLIILINKALTVVKSLPSFLFASNENIESIQDIFNSNQSTLFEDIITINLSEFQMMVDCGFLVEERLDRSIQGFYLVGKQNKYMNILSEIKHRQSLVPYLFYASNYEVFTPLYLVKNMLDKLSSSVWLNPNLKFLDSACKSGIFLSEIIIRLMVGLKWWEPDENKRYNHIIKNMVYGYAYTKIGCILTRKLIYSDSSFVGNIKELLFIDDNDSDMKFDVIVGNPPYNAPRDVHNGSVIWDLFIKESINRLKSGGFLCFVHPSGWRKIQSDLWDIITKNRIHYLEIHSLKDGQKTFKKLTRYDWYILEKDGADGETVILDELGILQKINLKHWKWFPNSSIDILNRLVASKEDEKCSIIHSNNYRTDKPWISLEKTKKFKHPVTLNVKDGNYTFCYSSRRIDHFGEPKVICNCNGYNLYPINDFDGNFGMNKFCFGIKISSHEEGELIIKAIKNPKFKKFVESMTCSGYHVDYKVFQLLKKVFWKEFLNE